MASIRVRIRDNYIKSDGTCQVYLQLFISKKKITVPTGVEINPDDYDKEKNLVRQSDKNHQDYNLMINDAKAKANSIFIKYHLLRKEITPELFIQEYKNPTIRVDFYEFMSKEIENRRKSIADSTLLQHLVILRKLKRYKKTLVFSEIDHEFIEGFRKHLKVQLGNNLNTQRNALKTFKTYVNIAYKRGILEKSPFDLIKIGTIETVGTHLNDYELKKLIKLYKNPWALNGSDKKALRHFLFCCFTGLRISDLINLRFDMIINKTLILTPFKTRNLKQQNITIPLCKPALRLIKDENSKSNRVFQTFAEQTMNRKLKDIAELVEIKKNISTHVGRHTFATLFLENNPGDVATLNKLMGHSRLQDTMAYVTISQEMKKRQISKFDDYI